MGCDNPRMLAGCLSKPKPCTQAMIYAGLLKGLLEAGGESDPKARVGRLITDGMCADPVHRLDLAGLPFKANVAPGQPAVELVEFADLCAATVPRRCRSSSP